MDMKESSSNAKQALPVLVLGALGVVYGDIGTSPLYALRECFMHALEPSHDNVVGIVSVIFWSLLIVISGKYAALIVRADNRGEGGILALTTLVLQTFPRRSGTAAKAILGLGLFGTTMLYGDSVITPAISVLSAVEGLEVATHLFEPYVLPITAGILFALFAVQRHGTAHIGRIYGPIMLVWFCCLGLLGLGGILDNPAILSAINPVHAVRFIIRNAGLTIAVFGSVVLVLTGGEALYTDLGHFGRKPIQCGWYGIALPSLTLNYFGQGALLLENPETIENPFFLLAPRALLYPLVGLATAATIIASQAVISGAFSLTRQAVLLGYLPRLRVLHTSAHSIGQIYVPAANQLLFILTLSLVLIFRSSTNLAGAYGFAVTCTMVISSTLLLIYMLRAWKWKPWLALSLMGALLVSDVSFWCGTALKLFHGGWFPLLLGSIVFCVMVTWMRGRALLGKQFLSQRMPLDLFLQSLAQSPEIVRVPRTAVFLASNWETTPVALLHNMKHNMVLHEKNVLLSIVFEEIPHVPEGDRIQIRDLGSGFYGARARYGFMESPSINDLVAPCKELGINLMSLTVGYFLGRENIRIKKKPSMHPWLCRLFSVMARNAEGVTSFLEIPANQVVELGVFVEL